MRLPAHGSRLLCWCQAQNNIRLFTPGSQIWGENAAAGKKHHPQHHAARGSDPKAAQGASKDEATHGAAGPGPTLPPLLPEANNDVAAHVALLADRLQQLSGALAGAGWCAAAADAAVTESSAAASGCGGRSDGPAPSGELLAPLQALVAALRCVLCSEGELFQQ
jgi:hypothetical protein